jgi:hypothetical protein
MTEHMSVKEFRELQTKVIASGGKITAAGAVLRLDRLPGEPKPQKPVKIIVRESRPVHHEHDAVQEVRDRLRARQNMLES